MTIRACLAALLLVGCQRPSHKTAAAPGAAAVTRASPSRGCIPGATLADVALYCIELIPDASIAGNAQGHVQLAWSSSPFELSVSRDGHLTYALHVVLSDLPPPAALGPYGAYVAWVAEPLLGASAALGSAPDVRDYADHLRWSFRGERRLGVVGNGLTELGPVDLDKFLILITAEASAAVTERHGPLVFRGYSPSTRLQPGSHSMLAAGVRFDPYRLPFAAVTASAHMHGHGWSMPPENPMVPMVMGPQMPSAPVMPFLPPTGGTGGTGGHIATARPGGTVRLHDGDTLRLEAMQVRRTLAGRSVTMYAFNGQYPGPLIDVSRGSTITVRFTNHTDLPSSIHWHGVRLENRNDGTGGMTQEPVPPGGTYVYRVFFRDAGLYWYHPHQREDIQQDLGLYGNIIVRDPTPGFYGPTNREEFLIVDDVLLGDEGLYPYGEEAPTHALMGRVGNVFLVNGEPRFRRSVDRGAVVRFFLTNAANSRTFNLSFGGLPLKLVGSDGGKFERETWTPNVVLGPGERYIVEVRFDRPGTIALTNQVRSVNHLFGTFYSAVDTLGSIIVGDVPASPDYGASYGVLRRNADVTADIDRYRQYFDRPPDHRLLLTLDASKLPISLAQGMQLDSIYFHPVEWDRTMPMMNWLITGDRLRWVLRDPDTGLENMAIAWPVASGSVMKVRVQNQRSALHAMQHPLHLHGQRFLVLARNGIPNAHLVWKDTILLPVGSTADILIDASNPGKWMMHCHIAEHLGSGMHMTFEVTP